MRRRDFSGSMTSFSPKVRGSPGGSGGAIPNDWCAVQTTLSPESGWYKSKVRELRPPERPAERFGNTGW